MLEMGFEPQLKEIFGELPSSESGRQTLLFTATWPKAVRKMAASYLAKDTESSEGNVHDAGRETGAVKIFLGEGRRRETARARREQGGVAAVRARHRRREG